MHKGGNVAISRLHTQDSAFETAQNINMIDLKSNRPQGLFSAFLSACKQFKTTLIHGPDVENLKARQLLKQSEFLFQQMAENISDIFWVTDAKGAIPIYVSPAYEKVFGRTLDNLYSNPKEFFLAAHPDDRCRLADVIRKQRLVSYSCEIEYRIVRPDGEERWLWARLSSMFDEHGKLTGLCGVTNDITERKEAEKRVSEFYSTVSHELRTPLTSIRGALGLIEGGLAGEISEKGATLIKIARTESDRLIRLINDILDIRKIQAGMLELKKQRIAAEALIMQTVDSLQGIADEGQIVLETRIDSTGFINCDRDRIVQVLNNLISNAIKFSQAHSKVLVVLKDGEPDNLRIEVIDHGMGISTKNLQKLFVMFQQLDSSDSREKGGTGLGLAISKAIIETHSGQIGVESELGVGSKFWFELAKC